MGCKDANYQVVPRGETLQPYIPGGWVLFQRAKEYGGGWWFGRTYDDCFWLEFPYLTSLGEAIVYIIKYDAIAARHLDFEEFELE